MTKGILSVVAMLLFSAMMGILIGVILPTELSMVVSFIAGGIIGLIWTKYITIPLVYGDN